MCKMIIYIIDFLRFYDFILGIKDIVISFLNFC